MPTDVVPRLDQLATITLTLGIVGLCCLPTAVAAVVCGVISISRIRNSGGTLHGSVAAGVGLGLGLVTGAAWTVGLLALLPVGAPHR